jgi:hypothetical protein
MKNLTEILNEFEAGTRLQASREDNLEESLVASAVESDRYCELSSRPARGGFPAFTPFSHTAPLPQFPLVELYMVCPNTADFICAASDMIQAPADLVGASVLGTLEIACRGKFPVCLPNGHRERPCLYIVPIAPPSERKSGVIDTVARPLIDFEREYNKHNEDEPLRLFGADVTPEKLAAMLKSQDGVFALLSAEGGGLFENIGRYSDKGGLEIYLGGYSGDRVCVDRKTSESIVIDCPTLSILAPVQPSVIGGLFSDKEKTGRGLLSRILFVRCSSRVGGRKAMSNPISEVIGNKYKTLCQRMLSTEGSGDLRFDNAGFAVYDELFDEIEPKLTPDIGELAFMADWAGKLHGQMIRLAGLIHCIAAFEQGRNPLQSFITAEEAKAAAALARYFLAHAKAVYIGQAEPKEITSAKYLWERVISLNSLKFNKSDLTRKIQNKADFDYTNSLQTLINKGYIRVETVLTGSHRPIEMIFVNPDAMKK